MERLAYEFPGRPVAARNRPVLAGVVGSGNLEVLVEPADLAGACRVVVETSAAGFAPIWARVVEDFSLRWQVGDVLVSINDAGATPAVVALRLDQALSAYLGRRP